MKSIAIKLKIPPEMYEATKQFMEEKGKKVDEELAAEFEKLYRKYVPSDVRKYIERNAPKPSFSPVSKEKNVIASSDSPCDLSDL